jgi:hypothetical protein
MPNKKRLIIINGAYSSYMAGVIQNDIANITHMHAKVRTKISINRSLFDSSLNNKQKLKK